MGALFVVVTTCAVLVAGATPVVQATAEGKHEAIPFFVALGAGAVFGLMVGLAVGILQFRATLCVLLGGGAGSIIGLAVGAMALLSQRQVGAAAAAVTAGSALIVGVALLMRRAG